MTDHDLNLLGTTTAEVGHGPFLRGAAPAVLRRNPAIMRRAEEIRQEKGVDPLSDDELDHARQRNRFWGKKFYRQVALAFLWFSLGLFGFGVLYGVDDGRPSQIALIVTLAVWVLFFIAFFKAVDVRHKRRQDIGALLDAYQELDRLYRQHQASEERLAGR